MKCICYLISDLCFEELPAKLVLYAIIYNYAIMVTESEPYFLGLVFLNTSCAICDPGTSEQSKAKPLQPNWCFAFLLPI